MKIFILIFILNGTLQQIRFDDYNKCLEEASKLDNASLCIESVTNGINAKIYPEMR